MNNINGQLFNIICIKIPTIALVELRSLNIIKLTVFLLFGMMAFEVLLFLHCILLLVHNVHGLLFVQLILTLDHMDDVVADALDCTIWLAYNYFILRERILSWSKTSLFFWN